LVKVKFTNFKFENNKSKYLFSNLTMGCSYSCKKNEKDSQEVNLFPIPFVPPISYGTVIKVYDGDTITITSKLPYDSSPLYKFSVRLNGIDCPEIKGKCETEKEVAKVARDTLSSKIMGKLIQLKNVQTEKYGRVLAEVWFEGVCMNTWLVKQRLAVEYDGGTKICPKCWKEYYINGKID
jgi:endonuclease YncB( thermonuclease family)